MRRDLVTQVIVEWADGEVDNFATPFEAERYINAMLDELDVRRAPGWRTWPATRSGITTSSKTTTA